MDVFRNFLVLDTSISVASNSEQREYDIISWYMSVLYFNTVAHHVVILCPHPSRWWSRCARDHNAFDAVNPKAMSLPVHATLVIMLHKGTFKTLKINLIPRTTLNTKIYKDFPKTNRILDIKYFWINEQFSKSTNIFFEIFYFLKKHHEH